MKLKNNIVLIGMPGCGKTTIAKLLSRASGMEQYDIDKCIEYKAGKTIAEIFLQGEDYFRKIESKVVEDISSKASVIISTGGGVVKLSHNMELLSKNGVIIFINRPVEKILADIHVESRPLLKNNAESLYNLYAERYPLYKKYCDFEIVNDKELGYVVNCIMNILRKVAEE